MNTKSIARFALTISAFALIAALSLTQAGCGSSSSSSGADTGTLTLRVTDGPVDDVMHVFIKFDAIEVKPANGPSVWYDLGSTQRIDLNRLTGGESALLLDSVTLEAGQYNWIRLYVKTASSTTDPATIDYVNSGISYAVVGGVPVPLVIPSSANTGLKLNRPIVVPAGGAADFIIDFDLRKSLHYAPGGDKYILRPTLRMLDNNSVGAIAGEILNIPATSNCADGTVYVFTGAGVTPDDVDGIDPDPVTSAKAVLTTDQGCRYRAAFLSPGDYTVAFTWDAALDDPAVDDVLDFPFVVDATVTANATAQVDVTLP